MLWYWVIRAPTASSLAGLRNGGGWELDIVGVMVGLTGGPRWYVLVVVSRVYLYLLWLSGHMQFLKSLTPGGVPNGDPSPRNRRFQTAFQFCVVDSKCRWATEQALNLPQTGILCTAEGFCPESPYNGFPASGGSIETSRELNLD